MIVGAPQLDSSAAPSGGPAISFAGTDKFISVESDWGTAPSGSVFSVFVRDNLSVSFPYDGDPEGIGLARQTLVPQASSEVHAFGFSGPPDNVGNNLAPAGFIDANVWTIASLDYDTDGTVRFNGVDQQPDSMANLASGGMGGLDVGKFLQGDIAELIILPEHVSVSELLQIEAALSERWDIPIANPIITGDMDCDGDIDFDDIDDFVLGLNDPADYQSMFGVPPSLKGDTDGDNDLDFDDITGFVEILSGGSSAVAGIPEPETWLLALFGALGAVLYSVRGRPRPCQRVA